MRKAVSIVLGLSVLGALVFYGLTVPVLVPADVLPRHKPDLENGRTMFVAGGCAECHAVPVKGCGDLDIEDETVLAGGRCMKTDVGIFHVPNISPDKETGIGRWSTLDFVNAMKRGVAPGGVHLYPAFPYDFYQRMRFEDLIDLKAYLDGLPPARSVVPPHDLRFPYNIRRGVGLFQRLYVDGKTWIPDESVSETINRGAYLVMGPGHCGACHTPRNLLGGSIEAEAYAGARNPEGKGTVPNITPSGDGIGAWSEEDIAYFLETGSTPDFDVVGGLMVPVQENMAALTENDREAIAAFLKSLPPRPDAVKTR